MYFTKSMQFSFLPYKYHGVILQRHLSGLNLWNESLSTPIKHKIETYWSNKLPCPDFKENDSREKYYVLSMFPYPSGHLHMGHVRVYTISDTIARYQRMNNKNVIHPIGWDAFGLPAENAAIERGVAPHEWTKQNIALMKRQLQQLGCSFEWSRELATCDPSYYHWTQELFLKLFDAGLAYQKEASVNWDPIDQTVLADEQVDENGCSWRSGARIEKKFLKQWFIRTTHFAKDLLEGLDDPILQDWRDITKIQKNWIGECNGITFDFALTNVARNTCVSLWTSTPEYVDRVKFIALSSSHHLSSYEGELLSDGTKKLHVQCVNPINGERIPIFVTDQIEYPPGGDSHLGIPAICNTDANFANIYNLTYETLNEPLSLEEISQKRELIIKQAQNVNCGGYWTSARLKDWLISRQRYWGTPIPIVHCLCCGAVPVRREDLPVQLPLMDASSRKGGSHLAELDQWVNVSCPKCGGDARRETDTMDTFVDSSWYYLRYLDTKNERAMFDVDQAQKMTPVDLYIGGKEHATLHLYYARFISHFLHSLGLLPEREPFKRLLVQGMVMGRSFRIKGTGKYVSAANIDIIDLKKNKAICKETQEQVVIAWEKMSKSKHNGVDPNDMFNEYGIDTTRLLILADVSPTSHRNWNSNTFPGILNWQKRLWITLEEFLKYRSSPQVEIAEELFKKHDDYMFDSRNYYLKGVTFNYLTSQQISVGISKMQGLTNSLRKMPPAIYARSLQFERALACQLIFLAPAAPHFASELWSGFVSAPNRLNQTEEIDWEKGVLEQRWPDLDSNYKLDLVCQVNGEDVAVVKIPRFDIRKLDSVNALNLALIQKEMVKALNDQCVMGSQFTVYEDYESVIDIRIPFTKKAKKVRKEISVA